MSNPSRGRSKSKPRTARPAEPIRCRLISRNSPIEPEDSDPTQRPTETEVSEEDMLVAAAAASRAVLAELDRPDRSSIEIGAHRQIRRFQIRLPPRPPGRYCLAPALCRGAARYCFDTARRHSVAAPAQSGFRLSAEGKAPSLKILPSDFRYIRFRHRTESTAIFAVDASGSTAMERLAEAKGAIELLLGDCYVRRDHVALITFAGEPLRHCWSRPARWSAPSAR
jgi:magnesium chelatase subunit D